jgi:hypothetical protein
MVVSVKPKAGRLASGAYISSRKIVGSPFPETPITDDSLPVQGGIVMPSDRTTTVYRNPNYHLRDTATQMRTTPLVQQGGDSTTLVTSLPIKGQSHEVMEIAPHEKGKFFPTKVTPINKTQFGASGDKTSNTAFHPHPSEIIPRTLPVSSMRARKQFYPSFVTNNNLWADANNSFLNNRANPLGNGFGSGRWDTTKRSVV